MSPSPERHPMMPPPSQPFPQGPPLHGGFRIGWHGALPRPSGPERDWPPRRGRSGSREPGPRDPGPRRLGGPPCTHPGAGSSWHGNRMGSPPATSDQPPSRLPYPLLPTDRRPGSSRAPSPSDRRPGSSRAPSPSRDLTRAHRSEAERSASERRGQGSCGSGSLHRSSERSSSRPAPSRQRPSFTQAREERSTPNKRSDKRSEKRSDKQSGGPSRHSSSSRHKPHRAPRSDKHRRSKSSAGSRERGRSRRSSRRPSSASRPDAVADAAVPSPSGAKGSGETVTPSPVSSAEPGEAPPSTEKMPLSLPSSPVAVLDGADPQCQPTPQQQLLPPSQSPPLLPHPVADIHSLPPATESELLTLCLPLEVASDATAVKAESSDEGQPVVEAVTEEAPPLFIAVDIPESPVSSAPSDIPDPYMSPERCALCAPLLV